VKIADFGLSREIEEDAYNASDVSLFPIKWSPPEVIQHRIFSIASDIWSFGVVMWEIFEFAKVPYPELTNREAIDFVLKGGRLEKPSDCPQFVYDVMKSCWEEKPENRPPFKSIQGLLMDGFVDMEQSSRVSVAISALSVPTDGFLSAPSVSKDFYNAN